MTTKTFRPLDNPIHWFRRWETLEKRIEQTGLKRQSYTLDDSIDPHQQSLINNCYLLLQLSYANDRYGLGSIGSGEFGEQIAPQMRYFLWNRNLAHLNTQSQNITLMRENLLQFLDVLFKRLYEKFYPVEHDHFFKSRQSRQKNVNFENIESMMATFEGEEKDSLEFSSDLVLSALLGQSTVDFLRIQQAYHLRYSALDEGGQQNGASLQDVTFSMADVLACEAVKKAFGATIGNGPFPMMAGQKTAVITYPTNRVEIRILPYSSNALLIGFPATAFASFKYDEATKKVDISMSTAFLSLPHEAGHHVYRHGRISKKDVLPTPLRDPDALFKNRQSLPIHTYLDHAMAHHRANGPAATSAIESSPLDKLTWEKWKEELFADVFSCLSSGPVSVVGFQELMESEQVFRWNDGHSEHPPSDIRPLIQTDILRIITEKSENWQAMGMANIADKLDARWRRRFEQRPPNEVVMDYGRLQAYLRLAVETLLTLGVQPYAHPHDNGLFATQLKECEEEQIDGDDVADLLFTQYCKISFRLFLEQHTVSADGDGSLHWLEEKLNAISNKPHQAWTDAILNEVIRGGWGDRGDRQSGTMG